MVMPRGNIQSNDEDGGGHAGELGQMSRLSSTHPMMKTAQVAQTHAGAVVGSGGPRAETMTSSSSSSFQQLHPLGTALSASVHLRLEESPSPPDYGYDHSVMRKARE